jgi:hypothetical protein
MVTTRGAQRRLEDLCTLRNKYGAGIQRMGVNDAAYCVHMRPVYAHPLGGVMAAPCRREA